LLDAHGKKWAKTGSKFTTRIEFRRGFVEEMALQVAKFLANADAIFAATPLLALRPLQARPVWDDFLASEHLGRLRTLDLHCRGRPPPRPRRLAAATGGAGPVEQPPRRRGRGGPGGLGCLGEPPLAGPARLPADGGGRAPPRRLCSPGG